MSASNLLAFSENVPTMSCDEGLAFVERTRRQLDRFGVALPGMTGRAITPEYEQRIRILCDELEADILAKMEGI